MPAHKRTKSERERQLSEIERAVIRGESQIEIAARLGLSSAQICYDVKEIMSRWSERMLAELNEHKERELAKIGELERAAWRAWEESLVPKTTEYSEQGIGEKGKTTRAGRKVEQSYGNPAYLAAVLDCIDRRIKLLGLDAPIKIDIAEKVRAVAREMGIDEDEAVKEAQRIIQAGRSEP